MLYLNWRLLECPSCGGRERGRGRRWRSCGPRARSRTWRSSDNFDVRCNCWPTDSDGQISVEGKIGCLLVSTIKLLVVSGGELLVVSGGECHYTNDPSWHSVDFWIIFMCYFRVKGPFRQSAFDTSIHLHFCRLRNFFISAEMQVLSKRLVWMSLKKWQEKIK